MPIFSICCTPRGAWVLDLVHIGPGGSEFIYFLRTGNMWTCTVQHHPPRVNEYPKFVGTYFGVAAPFPLVSSVFALLPLRVPPGKGCSVPSAARATGYRRMPMPTPGGRYVTRSHSTPSLSPAPLHMLSRPLMIPRIKLERAVTLPYRTSNNTL